MSLKKTKDKYRPSNLSKMDIHKELSSQLENVSKNDDFPHMLFFGPTGAGKKTVNYLDIKNTLLIKI